MMTHLPAIAERYKSHRLDLGALIKWVLIFGAIVLGGGITLLFFRCISKTCQILILVLMLTAVTAAFYYAVFGYRLAGVALLSIPDGRWYSRNSDQLSST